MKRTMGTVERFSPDWIKAIPRWLARGIWDAIEEGIEGGEHAGTEEKSRRLRNIRLNKLKPTNRGVVVLGDGAIDKHEQRCRDRAAKTAELQRERAKRISERLTAARRAEQDGPEGDGGGESEAGGSGDSGQGTASDNVLLHPGGSEIRVQDGGGGDTGDGSPDPEGDGVPAEKAEEGI